jgi:hypothetical protein
LFNKNKEINTRLKLLLAYPTRFKKRSGHDVTVDPIWWFHGSSASPIDSFKILDRKKVLMNIDELLIEKIAAYRGRLYYEDFVYVQCLADKPTGIYKYDKDKIPELNKNYDEYREEFGVYKHRFISRREYDDGSALIRGKPVRVEDAELRTRNLTRYNFIIAAKFSPYNCDDFYTNSDVYFIQLLKNEIDFDVFINWMRKFPKNRNDY